MSQVIREAVDLLLSVVDKIDARMGELDAERTLLVEKRRELCVIINGHGSSSEYRRSALEVRDEVAASAPAARPASPSAPTPSKPTGIKRVDAANRILDALTNADGRPLRYRDLARAARVGLGTTKDVVASLVASGQMLRTGKTAATRYHLPTGRAKRSSAAGGAPVTGSPADDDSPGVQPAPMEHDAPTPPSSRPSVEVGAASDSQREGAIPDRALAPLPEAAADVEVFDVTVLDTTRSGEVDDEDIFTEPPYRAAPQPARYKPGTREPKPTTKRTPQDASWWMRPDANWEAEAKRMRTSGKAMSVPGQNHIIGMGSAF